ncbi:MAG: hypothetical protein KBA18_13580 [Kiritimatiellae bacterium]|nr:hypothetical protein [Kiritimatiellia bacterium]
MTTNKAILAIDPGAGGGYAIQPAFGMIEAAPMPEGMTAQIDAIRAIAANFPGLVAVIENVGFHRPGNSAVSTAKFARHVGHIEAALYTLGVPTITVTPTKWMAALGSLPADKKDRKNAIKERVARMFPHLNVTLKISDALGMMVYAQGKQI